MASTNEAAVSLEHLSSFTSMYLGYRRAQKNPYYNSWQRVISRLPGDASIESPLAVFLFHFPPRDDAID